jgi:hypothetical protein
MTPSSTSTLPLGVSSSSSTIRSRDRFTATGASASHGGLTLPSKPRLDVGRSLPAALSACGMIATIA